MKKARDQEEIKTIPQGCYECGAEQEEESEKRDMNRLTMDLNGNGYPVDPSAEKSSEGKRDED